jgi:hypothetical protein
MSDDRVLDYFKVACAAISIYNSVEVIGLAVTTFRRFNTLYFWSIMACSVGCILFAGGFLDLFYHLYEIQEPYSTVYRPLFVLTIGWYGMVTGFSLVMFSRLHLVMVPKQYIFYMKCFIIYNVIFSHFPTTILTFGSSLNGGDWTVSYGYMEKIQMTFFCIQEVILSSLYLNYTRKLKFSRKVTALVRQTLYVNIFVLILDLSMLVIEYKDLYDYQIMLKVVVYSIKLKLEFFILNILTKSLQETSTATNEGTKGVISTRGDQLSSRVGNKEIQPANPSEASPRREDTYQSQSDSQQGKGEA